MSEELKPCPLCGCHGIAMTSVESNPMWHSIKCDDCPCGANFYSSTRDEAIAAWNRRAAPQPAPAIGDARLSDAVPLTRYRINLADGTDSADPDGGYFRDTDVAAMMARNELHMDQVMRERDGFHDKANELADAIAEYLGVELGEHSNLNCPWTNALEHIGAAHRREDQRETPGDKEC